MMKIVRKNISELKLAPYNPRTISDEEKEALKESIKRHGLVEPLVWNRRTGNVVGGNQRLIVLKELGEEEVEVVEVDMDLEQEKALNLALNKISGDWDKEKLFEILKELQDTDWLEATGFTPNEIADLYDEFSKLTDEIMEEFEDFEKPDTRFEVVLSFATREQANEWLEKQGFSERLKTQSVLVNMDKYLE
ncbi:ParB N-terminal domain-containing protein [bacterium]|nr:ParB N-terminal domain-containing protein [bacterium]